MPSSCAVDQEERRQLLAVDERVRHHDVDARHVAVGHEPLLAVDHPAALAAARRGLDPRRVGAGLGLGDRVRVVQLAAQRRLEVALDLLGRAAAEHVVGARHVPRERVRGAPELLLDQEPLDLRPALPAVLHGMEPAREPRLHSLALDPSLQLVGDLPAGPLRELLVRDQDLVDEAPCPLAQLELLRREVGRGLGGGAAGVIVIGASSSWLWLCTTSSTTARASATAGSSEPAARASASAR